MKRLLIAVLIISLTIVLATGAVAESVASPLLGDASLDGVVESTDALTILQYVVGKVDLNEVVLASSDVDGDGKVDTNDALYILKKVVGKIPYFPMEEQPMDFAVGKFEVTLGYAFADDYLRLNYSGEDEYIPTQLIHCKSLEQLEQIVMAQGSSFENEWQLLESKYSAPYFAQQDLLLLCVQMPSEGGSFVEFQPMLREGEHIKIDANVYWFGSGFSSISDRMYFLELPQKYNALTTGTVTYHCFDEEKETVEQTPDSLADEILVRECNIQS